VDWQNNSNLLSPRSLLLLWQARSLAVGYLCPRCSLPLKPVKPDSRSVHDKHCALVHVCDCLCGGGWDVCVCEYDVKGHKLMGHRIRDMEVLFRINVSCSSVNQLGRRERPHVLMFMFIILETICDAYYSPHTPALLSILLISVRLEMKLFALMVSSWVSQLTRKQSTSSVWRSPSLSTSDVRSHTFPAPIPWNFSPPPLKFQLVLAR